MIFLRPGTSQSGELALPSQFGFGASLIQRRQSTGVEHHRNDGPTGGIVGKADRAGMFRNDLVDDGEAQSGAARARRHIGLDDPVAFGRRMAETYGPVYRNNSFGGPNIVLLGPDANELVLFDRDKIFSSEQGWSPALHKLFPRGLTLLDLKDIGTEQLSMSNIAARQELRDLIAELKLPGVAVNF